SPTNSGTVNLPNLRR
ncbi:hypothetical protein D030_4516B, partial [Vibrio parahaemolyticus AQ3810]